jgi:hypothetical protein
VAAQIDDDGMISHPMIVMVSNIESHKYADKIATHLRIKMYGAGIFSE